MEWFRGLKKLNKWNRIEWLKWVGQKKLTERHITKPRIDGYEFQSTSQ